MPAIVAGYGRSKDLQTWNSTPSICGFSCCVTQMYFYMFRQERCTLHKDHNY